MEKEQVIATRDKLRDVLEAKNTKAKVGKIVYYKDFEIIKGDKDHSPFSEQDIFVVTRKVEQDGLELTYYEIYDEKYSMLASTDGSGEMQYSEEYKKKLGPMYSHLKLDERKMYLNRENEFTVNDKPKEEMTVEEKVANKNLEQEYEERKIDSPEPALMEDDLGIDRKSITYCQQIKDTRFFDMVPESKQFSRTAMLIYSDKMKTFMVVGIKDGKFQPYTTIEPAKSTLKTSKDLDRTGKYIQDDTITGILKFKGNREFDFSVDIEADGRIEFQQLRRDLETGELMTSDLETDTQYRASWDVEQMMNKNKNKDITEEMKKLEELGGEGNIEQIKDEDEEDKEKVPWDRDPRR